MGKLVVPVGKVFRTYRSISPDYTIDIYRFISNRWKNM